MTPNQAMRANVATIEALAGREIPELRDGLPVAPAPRKASDPADTEAPVIKAISELLATHPKVLFALRVNSGSLPYVNNKGQRIPVQFHRILTKQPVRVCDFFGWLKDSRPFAFEAKRPSWRKPSDEREYQQANFLMLIRNIGGVASFVRSADEALEIING